MVIIPLQISLGMREGQMDGLFAGVTFGTCSAPILYIYIHFVQPKASAQHSFLTSLLPDASPD